MKATTTQKGNYNIQFLMICMLFSFFTGCYRMPTDDDYSLIPMTNNPSVTRERGNQLIPNGDF